METSTDDASDQQLVESINAGDSDAFEVLYNRYRDWVVGLAWRFTGHHDDSLDVLQETFSYVMRKFPGFELTASMTTFLYPAVRNLSISARRKRQKSVGTQDDSQRAADMPAPDLTQYASSPDCHELAKVLSVIPDSHREILLMRFVDEMTQQEIADALELPLGTVKSRLHHAVNKVRNSPAVLQYLTSQS